MKIYVDKIPKSCSQCVCCDTDKWCNAFSVYTENPETKKNCQLKSLSEHDKEKRNELIDEIVDRYNLNNKPIVDTFGDINLGCAMVNANDLKKFLDQLRNKESK